MFILSYLVSSVFEADQFEIPIEPKPIAYSNQEKTCIAYKKKLIVGNFKSLRERKLESLKFRYLLNFEYKEFFFQARNMHFNII